MVETLTILAVEGHRATQRHRSAPPQGPGFSIKTGLTLPLHASNAPTDSGMCLIPTVIARHRDGPLAAYAAIFRSSRRICPHGYHRAQRRRSMPEINILPMAPNRWKRDHRI